MDDLLAEVFDNAGFVGLHLRWWLVCRCSWLPFNVCSLENQNYFTCLLWHIPAASRYLTFSGSCCCSLRCCQQYWRMARAKKRTLFLPQISPSTPPLPKFPHSMPCLPPITPIRDHVSGPSMVVKLSVPWMQTAERLLLIGKVCCKPQWSLWSVRTLQIMSPFDFQLPLTTNILNTGKSSCNFLFCTSGSQNSHLLGISTCSFVHL